MSEHTQFSISYDGEALRSHSMDVRDLAPALLSLGKLFDESNRVLNGNKASVKLQVKAHEEGSFEVLLELYQTYGERVTRFLTGEVITSALTLKELLLTAGGVGASLYALIKKLKGSKPDRITNLENGMVRIEISGESFEISLKLISLFQDIEVRRAAEEVLKPLGKPGIDTFQIKHKSETVEMVTKEELEFFSISKIEDEKILESEQTTAFSIVSLAFKDDNKWRLHDGSSTLSVIIRDEDFLRKIDSNSLSFAKGDVLICRVRTTQWQTPNGLRSEHIVTEVLEHKPAMKQISLFD